MPYNCTFCGKVCATHPGLERHIAQTPNCKNASREKFVEYAKGIWDDIPPEQNQVEEEAFVNLPDWPDFHLEEDIQMAEGMLYGEDDDLLRQPPPHQSPPLPQDEPEPNPQNNDGDSGRYIENFPEEYFAGAIWGHCKSHFENLNNEQKRVGSSCWAPFEDEDEWQLAEWLIRNVGQKQTDTFLKLPIV